MSHAKEIVIFGLNHKTAPLSLREKAVFYQDTVARDLSQLLAQGHTQEATILSTCNRTEIYAVSSAPHYLQEWFAERAGLCLESVAPHLYEYRDLSGILKHSLRVACGLDSMVLGEAQIFGQLKQAYALAKQMGAVGTQLSMLFPFIFASTKRVRQLTAIGENTLSFANIAVNLMKHIFEDIQNTQCLLIGSGETIHLMARQLASERVKPMMIASRQLQHAKAVADKFGGIAFELSELASYLPLADGVISATASPFPILGKGLVERAMKQRKHRPMFMLDLAVPRDIEAEISEMEGVFLYDLDDLQAITQKNYRSRKEAAQHAERLIEEAAAHFMNQQNIVSASERICAYRANINTLVMQELGEAKKRLKRGIEAEDVLDVFARRLAQKITHTPTIKLRELASSGDEELLSLAYDLLDLN